MMHGLTGEPNSTLQYLGARYLCEKGFTVLRLAMYSVGDHYRSLFDCTLDTHVSDFEDVIRWLRKKSQQKLFAIGHSYGGLTVLASKAQLDGAVLWDPTHGLVFQQEDDDFVEKTVGEFRIGLTGTGYVIPETIVRYNENLGDNSTWAAAKEYPIKFIAAGDGALKKYVQAYYDVATQPKEFCVIEGAQHNFLDSDDVTHKLYEETVGWLDHYS